MLSTENIAKADSIAKENSNLDFEESINVIAIHTTLLTVKSMLTDNQAEKARELIYDWVSFVAECGRANAIKEL